jgi:hypothetical protein
MSTDTPTTPNRGDAVLAAWLSACPGRTQNDEPAETFRLLATAVPDLRVDDIVAAADVAKQLGSRLRGVAHRILQAEAREQIRCQPR